MVLLKKLVSLIPNFLVLSTWLYADTVTHEGDFDVDIEELTRVDETLKGIAPVESVAGVARSQGNNVGMIHIIE